MLRRMGTSVDYAFTPERVKRIRITLGLTHRAFAAKLGVSINNVARWESGASTPSNGPILKALLDAEREADGA